MGSASTAGLPNLSEDNQGIGEFAAEDGKADRIVVGFSQLGAESDWRSANTQSMLDTFTAANGYELIYENGQQKQSNQITAIRKFIQQDVDYIVLAPVTENGWDTVLQEAREAGIPVILLDRMVDVQNHSLFTCWVGSDFELEGKKAAEWLNLFAMNRGIKPGDLHIVDIQGTIGATPQIGRSKGLADAAVKYGWDLLGKADGDFTQAKGREVTSTFLKRYDNLNVIYCENDNEAMGALEAIEAAGRTAGMDIEHGEILVISFDGVNQEALQDAVDGRIACIGECNPLQGPRVEKIIQQLENGETPEKRSYMIEGIFSADKSVQQMWIDGVCYPVRQLRKDDSSYADIASSDGES